MKRAVRILIGTFVAVWGSLGLTVPHVSPGARDFGLFDIVLGLAIVCFAVFGGRD